VSLWSGQYAAVGGRESRQERAFTELGERLVEELRERDDPQALEGAALMTGARGVSLFLRGRWRESRDALMIVDGLLTNSRAFWQSNARIFYMRGYFFMGDLKELAVRQERLHAEARERGDLYTLVNLDTTTRLVTPLARDAPEEARRNLEGSMARWSQTGFFVPQWQAMVYGPDIDLYAGRGADAYARFARDLPRLRTSFLLTFEFIRLVTLYSHGRLAVASIESESRRAPAVAEARRTARRLERESAPWAAGLAAIVRAAAENAAGDKAAAIAALRAAVRALRATDTIVYARSAEYRLGQLLGGAEGAELARRAAQELQDQGIRNPDRWASIALPGKWP
jgi:hypothetical protein